MPDPRESLLPTTPDLKPLSSMAARQRLFGKFEFQAAPTARNPEEGRALLEAFNFPFKK